MPSFIYIYISLVLLSKIQPKYDLINDLDIPRYPSVATLIEGVDLACRSLQRSTQPLISALYDPPWLIYCICLPYHRPFGAALVWNNQPTDLLA